jgi:multiple sugar transport system ATP-binding protein
MSEIEIKNLVKYYGSVRALDNVSLRVESGDFLVLLGPSGCGKTTLLRCIAGLEDPDGGEILIDGKPVFQSKQNLNIPSGKRNIGMVFQSYALWPHMTVNDNISFGLQVQKMPAAEMDSRISQVLEDLSMTGMEGRYPSELSGGQQQRVALARLLAQRPPVFLMDEPLSNLDARLRMDMRVELKRLHRAAGA